MSQHWCFFYFRKKVSIAVENADWIFSPTKKKWSTGLKSIRLSENPKLWRAFLQEQRSNPVIIRSVQHFFLVINLYKFHSILKHDIFSFQVTIRASVTGKAPISPISPDRSSLIVSPETLSFNQQTKPPVSISKSKSNVSAAGKTKTTQSKKQNSRTTKHNLSLKNLRLLMNLC